MNSADPRRDAGARQRRGFLVRQVRRDRHEPFGIRDDDLGEHAAGVAAARRRERRRRRRAVEPVLEEDAGDAIADFEARDRRADRDDFARAVRQRHAVRLRAAAPVLAGHHHEIAAIQRHGVHAHRNLVRCRRPRLDLAQRELERRRRSARTAIGESVSAAARSVRAARAPLPVSAKRRTKRAVHRTIPLL